MARRIAPIVGVVLCVVLGTQPTALAAGGAQVTHEIACSFEPGDIPGINQFFPGDCFQVLTPSGQALLVAHGHVPSGFSLPRTYTGPVPCTFLGRTVTGHVVATKSGIVRATCHFAS